MSINAWMPTLETKVGEIAGLDGGARAAVQSTADNPGLPHSIGEMPMALIFPTQGRVDYSSGGMAHEYTEVLITLYFATGILAEAVNTAVLFIALMRNKLAGELTLDNTCISILPDPEVWYEGPGGVSYGGKEYTGIVFHYWVKEDVSSEVTVAA
jgi:hypothetical protein